MKFVARQVEQTVVIHVRATTRSNYNAIMLQDKLNKNAARITGPLPASDVAGGTVTRNPKSSPGRGYCVVSLGKSSTLALPHFTQMHQEFNAWGNPVMD